MMNFSLSPFQKYWVLIKGAGDLASGVAYRLHRTGFPVVMTELPAPLFVRRAVCFGEAIYEGHTKVEGIEARRVETSQAAYQLAQEGIIPILVDPEARQAVRLNPTIIVDGIVAKINTGTSITDAALVIALGPGFSAGKDCHAVIETKRGHRLGRVIDQGQAAADTQTPGKIEGYATERVLRAPVAGKLVPYARIGDLLKQGDMIASLETHIIRAPFDGVLRGLIHADAPITPGLKIGDLDPRGVVEHCFTISEKSLAVAGGVLEAILMAIKESKITLDSL